MSKSTVTKIFFGSVIALTTGVVLTIIAVALAFANDVFVMNGTIVVDVRPSPLALALLVLGLVGVVAFIGGMIGGLVSWIGALLNTAQLDSKAWFLALLLLGIFNFGILGMIAYVIAGPDGKATTVTRRAAAPA